MKKIAALLIFALLSGCATSAAERRMRDADGDDSSDTWKKVAVGAAVVGVVAAALYASRNSNGGGAGYTAPVTDYDWAWDFQRAPNGLTMWVCRGMQTGQYAEKAHCAYKPMIDTQWPGI